MITIKGGDIVRPRKGTQSHAIWGSDHVGIVDKWHPYRMRMLDGQYREGIIMNIRQEDYEPLLLCYALRHHLGHRWGASKRLLE